VICGPLLLQSRFTNKLGQVLVDRVLNARCNWESDTLRSFCEVSSWLLVVWSTYVSSDGGLFGLTAALGFGTCAGGVLAMLGELLQQPLRNLERLLRESSASRARMMKVNLEEEETFVTSNIVMILLFGPTVLNTIYENCSDLAVLAGMLVLGGVTILAAGRLCQAWEPTRHLGTILQARILNTWENWRHHPGRSALESTFFCAVVMGVYELHGNWADAGCVWLWHGKNSYGYAATFRLCADGVLKAPFHQAPAEIASLMEVMRFLRYKLEVFAHGINFNLQEAEQRSDQDTALNMRAAGMFLCARAPDGAIGQIVNRRTMVQPAAFFGEAISLYSLAKTPSNGECLMSRTSLLDIQVGGVHAEGETAQSQIHWYAGTDASDQFAAFHRPRVYARLAQFQIGEVVGTEHLPSKATEEYRALRKKLWAEGWFKPRLSYFVCKAAICFSILTFVVSVVCCLTSAWFLARTILAGMALGVAWQQIAFLAHDADHWGITTPRASSSLNPLSWFLASVLFGISRSMWNEEHSMHHAITLRPQEDPQFNYLPLWLISKKELDVAGTHVGFLTKTLVSVQHFTFLPVSVVIGRFNFYLISMLSALKRAVMATSSRELSGGVLDVLGMLTFWTWYVALVSRFDTGVERTLFVLASNWTVGILHIQLVLSHLATETFTAEEERAEQFFAFQLKTSRNIDSSWYDHWFHGGLEFQIEHHLFPQLPRHNLSKVKPMVQDICFRHGIPYRSTSFSGALRDVLSDFRGLAMDIVKLKMG
ncbi:sld1, partial [Symbiodinium pilosum]